MRDAIFRILLEKIQYSISFPYFFFFEFEIIFFAKCFFWDLQNFGIYFRLGPGDFYLNCTVAIRRKANGRDDFAAPSAITMAAAWMAALQNLLPPALQRVFLAQRCRGSLGNCTCVLFATGTHFYSVEFDTIF